MAFRTVNIDYILEKNPKCDVFNFCISQRFNSRITARITSQVQDACIKKTFIH